MALHEGLRGMMKRLDGKAELTLEKTRELTLLHWGTLGLFILGCAAVAVSFSEVGFFPLLALAAACGFAYSWARAGKPRRWEDVMLGACVAASLAMVYGASLGRILTAASVATIVAAAAADAGVFMSFRLKRARDYRVVMLVSGAMVILSALSMRAACLPFIALYLLLLLPVGLQSNLEHLRRRERKGSLTQAVQGRGAGVLATYLLPALALLVAAALLYQVIPKPLREDTGGGFSPKPFGSAGQSEGNGGGGGSGSGAPGQSGTGESGSGSGFGSGSGESGSGGGSGQSGTGSGTGSGSSGESGTGSGSGSGGSGQSGQGSGFGSGSGESGTGSGSGSSGSGESGTGSGGSGQSGTSSGGSGESGTGSGSGSGSSQGGTGTGQATDGARDESGRGIVRENPPRMTEEERRSINNVVYLVTLIILLMLAAVLAFHFIRKWLAGRRKEREPREAEAARREAFKGRNQGEFICLTYAAMCAELARLGFPRAPSDTPGEYLVLISRRVPSVENEAGTITGALVDLLYAGRMPESSVLAGLDALLDQIRGKINVRLAAETEASG